MTRGALLSWGMLLALAPLVASLVVYAHARDVWLVCAAAAAAASAVVGLFFLSLPRRGG